MSLETRVQKLEHRKATKGGKIKVVWFVWANTPIIGYRCGDTVYFREPDETASELISRCSALAEHWDVFQPT